jgi:hypothetical protein
MFKAGKSEAISPKKRIILREFCWENHIKINCFKVQNHFKMDLRKLSLWTVQTYDFPVVGKIDSDDAVSGWILPQFRVLLT